MNALQTFLQSKPFGFITAADLPELIRLHRLCLCLVRTGCGRFMTPAQNVAHFLKCVEAGGDYVRDVSITSQEIVNAEAWRPEPAPAPRPAAVPPVINPRPRAHRADFNEADCGGVFDGTRVISDADPGL